MLSGKEMIKFTDRLLKENPEVFEALIEFEKTGRVPKFTYKKRYNFTIDPELVNKFRVFCEKKGIKMSTRIEQHIREDIA
ncbi:hypothetical protein HYX16_06540 [Candidatus Woesearchaeota archaeon]|nr:hypothetical protein [Candidatus Woesearchaeota archaeon]